MLNNEGQAAAKYALSPSNNKTATVTGSYIDVREVEGDLVIIQDVGAVITPNALLRDWLLANGYVEPVAVMKGTISLPLTQRVKNVVTRAARP